MSYILDALKKLEQKRQRGSVPDLMTVHLAESRKLRQRPVWLYLVCAALVVNAVILALWFVPWETEKKIAPPSAVVQQNRKDIAVNSREHPESNLSVSAPSLPSKKSGFAETTLPDSHKTRREESAARFSGDEKQNRKQIQAVQIEQKPSASLSHIENDRNQKTFMDSKLHDASSGSALKNKSLDAQPDNRKADLQNDIPELGQLPQSVRAEIPQLTILGHIYSDSSTTRMININGDIFREGDTLAKNIKIEQITENGVILNYDGLRFSIRAF
jgi:general secretion pathway protein B